MPTSGSNIFNATRDQIAISALRKVAAIGEDELPSSYMLDNAVFMLNTIIKEAHADGMPLWAIVEHSIPCSSLVNGSITIGPGMDLNIPAPLKILYAILRDNTNPNDPIDIPMTILTHYDYNWLSSKRTTGMPIQWMYQPLNGTGVLSIWPCPDALSIANKQVIITYQRPFEDAGVSTDVLDFPSSWNRALIYQLSWSLCPEYGVPMNDTATLAKTAELLWNRALSFGTEEGSLYISPDWSQAK